MYFLHNLQNCFGEQTHNFHSILNDGDISSNSSDLSLPAVLTFIFSKKERKSFIKQVGKLPYLDQQLAKIVEMFSLEDIIHHIEAFENFIVRITEHWMFANGKAELSSPSLRNIVRLSRHKQMVEIMSYQPLQKFVAEKLLGSWMSDPSLLVQKLSMLYSDQPSGVLKYTPIVFQCLGGTKALKQCLGNPTQWSIESVQDLEEFVCNGIAVGDYFRTNWAMARLLGHTESLGQVLADLFTMGPAACVDHYIKKAFSSLLTGILDQGASWSVEKDNFWMSPKCSICGFRSE